MTARSQGLLGRRSNKHSPVGERISVAVIASSLSSGCNSMHPIPSADQSIFKKAGLFESKRAKTGEVVRSVLHKWNKSRNSAVRKDRGITLQWYFLCNTHRDLMLTSIHGEKQL